jgi:hypothetical protein
VNGFNICDLRFTRPWNVEANLFRVLLKTPWEGLHSFAAQAALECGGKRSATPLWLARRGVPAQPKRRRRCALPAHSKDPACPYAAGSSV